ncbi:DUF420 domain-containing protein [Halovivax gelatinilyticus]|uniref:DUF420 domain-containing protein n=1 Tax=Halovivax gelatinilyticus TaxID=2961597 RepID=UPI0020CA88D6|nr:DUF420 domain-containing protein [Halovivax gelatinilyticus]
MASLAPDRVPWVTAVLSVISLALVFGAAGGRIPSSTVPNAPTAVLEFIPTVNVAISALAILTIAAGWRAIRRRQIERHRRLMVISVVLFATFLLFYLYRLVATGGAAGFDGPQAVYHYLYLPVLVGHIGLAMVCIPLLYYALLLTVSHEVRELHGTAHARVGRIVAPLWITSFALGIVVYLLGTVLY